MGLFKSIGRAISGVVKGVTSAVSSIIKSPAFQFIAPIALSFLLPGLGTAIAGGLGLSAGIFGGAISGATLAAGFGSAAISGGLSLLGGKSIGDSLKAAALSGLTAGAVAGASNLMGSSSPLSSMFSGTEGGAVGNPLTAGATGSTNLTGVGGGLGLDQSTLGTQFGQVAPDAGSFGKLNPNAGSTFGQLTPNPSNASSLLKAPAPGVLDSLRAGEYSTALKTAAGKLIPDSTMGKIALGAGALGILGGGGGGGQQPEPQMASDPSFGQKLEQKNFRYNPLQLNSNNENLNAYAMARGSVDPSTFNPATGQFGRRSDRQGEFQWVNPAYYAPDANATPAPTPVIAAGGMVPRYAYGGYLNHLASGGTMHQANAQQGGLVRGAGDGVSDDVVATVGGKQPVRLAGGEYVIPARAVSEIGNGSSQAGESRLGAMLKRINERRLKTRDIAEDSKSYNFLPA